MMLHVFLAFLVCVSPILAAVLPPAPAAAASPSLLHAGCWGVFDPADELTVDHADEVLCVDESGHASIRESSMFGEGVKGCNVVTIRSQGDMLVIGINYKRCTNNSPSHTLTCGSPSPKGIYSCTEVMADSTDKEGLPAKLAPLPAGQ
jgi:hypothetical protein